MRTLLLLLAALSLGSSAYADELADANQLFDFAEKTYTRYFSPAGQTTQTLQGYLVRYYPDTNSYLGTSGGSVYVHGQQFGVGIIRVGNVTDFITPATGAANTVVDLTNRILTRRAANCSDFAGSYQGTAQDFARFGLLYLRGKCTGRDYAEALRLFELGTALTLHVQPTQVYAFDPSGALLVAPQRREVH